IVPVRFASSQFLDIERGLILFSAFSNHSVIRCAITIEALVDNFEANPHTPLRSFVRYRHRIERVVEELIGEQRFKADGSVLVDTRDVQWLSDAMHGPIGARPPEKRLTATSG